MCRLVVSDYHYYFFMVHAGKLGQFTNFTIVGGTANHCVDQYTVLFPCFSLVSYTAMPGGLHARVCRAFLVLC